MGIGSSLHTIFGWRGQYERVIRWHQRVVEYPPTDASSAEANEYLDYLLAFFMNCYSFRDWFINSHDLTPMQIQDFKTLFQENIYLQLCRDICNGTKHLNYKKPSLDASPSIVRNFVPDPYFGEHAYPGKLLLIHADGQVYNLSELATSCVNALRDFLVSHGLIKE